MNKPTITYINTQERQLCSGQDFATSGRNLLNKNGKLSDWLLLADGHGGDQTINVLRNLYIDNKFEKIIADESPMIKLEKYIKEQNIDELSGTTCIIVKIFEDNIIQCWNVGDSQVAIFVNGQMIYINCPHNMRNPLEQLRLSDRIKQGRVIVKKMKELVPVINTKTAMTARVSEYIHFGNIKLAMTQVLGDYWVTGNEAEYFEYIFDPVDEVRIVAGSDGFWEQYIFEGLDASEDLADITSLTAEELIEKAEARWKQEWQYFWNPKKPNEFIITDYDGQYDDIALAIWSNRMPGPILLDTDQHEALDMWQDTIDAEVKEEEKDVDNIPGLITNEEFEYLKKVIEYYGTLVELEQEYIRSESLEIKNVLIHCITIAVSKMSKNEKKMKLSNKSDYELQEITNIEIELIKEWLTKE